MTTINQILNPNCDYGIVGQDDAKMALEDNLRLRATKNQPQKIILLEGFPGTGKSTLISEMCKKYLNKYPDRFEYITWGVSDLTAHVGTTSIKINEAWEKLSVSDKSKIVFIDEADEVLQTRKTTGNIRNERTTSIILKLGENMNNLLVICASNRPKMIDASILDRCEERINCDLPTPAELKKIIDLHMDYLSEDLKIILHGFMTQSNYKINGRDIKNLSNKLKTKLELKELDNIEPIILHEDISLVYEQLERSKRKLKMDYLDDEVDTKE